MIPSTTETEAASGTETATETGTYAYPTRTITRTSSPTNTPWPTHTITTTPTYYYYCDDWLPPENLGSSINTSYSEYNPIYFMGFLFYASDRMPGYGGYDIWYASEYCGDPCTWQNVSNGISINTDRNERGPFPVIVDFPSYFVTGLYYSSDTTGNFDIYYAVTKTSMVTYHDPVALPSPVNSGSNDMYFWLLADGNTAFLCSDRPGGYGGFDIYTVTKTAGVWCNEPVNLGPLVNSASNDECPSFFPYYNKLYFTSNRAGGAGGYDLWVSTRIGADWQAPVNICELNSAYNEYRPTFTKDNSIWLYFSSDRPGGYGSFDLYRSRIIP
jgi:hypothetical protein